MFTARNLFQKAQGHSKALRTINQQMRCNQLVLNSSLPMRAMSKRIDGNNEILQAQEYEYSLQQKQNQLQFSRQPTEKNFGDLERGEIPAPLQVDRPMETTVTSNGIRVCTEKMNNSQLAAVGVFIGAGSRNETLESSGAAHFLEHLMFKGTSKRSRRTLEIEVENTGT